ncbi:hypothetical protein ACFWN2_04580 [Lentzea sp. NPDC058436]|uniref:hypothetical protein n=1 Tax=Lentzea sp. NPDC058436 TaxID=3346499 RepID=UPI003657EF09
MLQNGGWILFQDIAARDLSKVATMSARLGDALVDRLPAASLAAATTSAVHAALAGWNPERGHGQFVSTAQHMATLLGGRLRDKHPLREWAYGRGLVAGADPSPTESDVDGLPNPFLLAAGDHPARGRRVYAVYGRAHGDLHPGNVLFGAEPEKFWFVDLARFGKSAPLTFDPVYLQITVSAHVLERFDQDMRLVAIDFLLDPSGDRAQVLPALYRDVIRAISGAAESWANETSRAQEWRVDTLLSFVACGLVMCGRTRFSEATREWFLRLSAAATARYLALDEPAFPAQVPARPVVELEVRPEPLPETEPLRIVAHDRASLRALTLPAVLRSRWLDLALERRDLQAATSGGRQILVVSGEGGIGKSVLLGQLLDRLEPGGQSLVLVSCGSVDQGAALSDLASVDLALGLATDRDRGGRGLLHLLDTQRAAHGSVVLLIDTLDLVLGEESAAPLAALLVEALGIGEVVVTCRTHEFRDYLELAPRLAGKITKQSVPPLDGPEIVDWANRYLRARPDSDDHSAFLDHLAGRIESSGSLLEVCSLPVRLALACETFGQRGYLPEDLSINDLYVAYWDARVGRQAGIAGVTGRMKENAALAVASGVVTRSGRIVVRVPKASIGAEHTAGLERLASEGVLRERPTEWEFFHQTFAEFAHARWLLMHGIESTEVAELVDRVTSGRANLWPVVGSVLLQVSDDDFPVVTAMIPMHSADATRTRVLGTLQRRDQKVLVQVLSELRDEVELLPVALAALGTAPWWHVPVAFDGAVEALRSRPELLSSPAIDALAQLGPRAAASADAVSRALREVSLLKGKVPEDKRIGYLQRLVRPFAAHKTSAEKLAVIRDAYVHLGPLGRREALRAHFAHAPTRDVVTLALTAVEYQCPPLTDEELVPLLLALWEDATARARLGWTTWREALARSMPKDWDNAQIKLVVHLAEHDEKVSAELVDELLDDDVRSPDRHVNAFAQLVAHRVDWAAARMLARSAPITRRAVSAVGKCGSLFASELDESTRLRLIGWLWAARTTAPRPAWPTQFALAGNNVETVRALLCEFGARVAESEVVVAVAHTLFHNTALNALVPLTSELRDLVAQIQRLGKMTNREVLQLRARLEGRLAEVDPDARRWIEDQVTTGVSPNVASTVIKTFVDAHAAAGPPARMVTWLAALLNTPHTDAAERLATMLLGARESFAEMDADGLAALVHSVIARMEAAVNRQEDSGLHRALLNLLIRLDDVRALGQHEVWWIYRNVRARLIADASAAAGPPTSDYPAAIRDMSTLSGTLMSRRLDSGTVRDMLAEIVLGLDESQLKGKVRVPFTSLLVSLAHRDPEAPDWLVAVFGTPGVGVEVQKAIARALLKLEDNMPGGRASALKDRPNCPVAVESLIVKELRS